MSVQDDLDAICWECGFQKVDETCPVCEGDWEGWELRFSPLPLPEIRAQIAGWLGQLPDFAVIEIAAEQGGVRLRLYGVAGSLSSAVASWAALTHQQTRWGRVENQNLAHDQGSVLYTKEFLPTLSISMQGDPFLAIAGQLLQQAQSSETRLRIWLLGKETGLQEHLRKIYAYAYGTESGVGDDAPNPWAMQLGLWKAALFLGMGIAGVSTAVVLIGWLPGFVGILGILAGLILTVIAGVGTGRWMRWRGVPKEVVQTRLQDSLLKVAFTIHSDAGQTPNLSLLAGQSKWVSLPSSWPLVQTYAYPLPTGEIAGLVAPPEQGEGSGIIHRDVWQDTISPPPSPELTTAPFKVGYGVATGEPIGIDPDGHGLLVGGTRTGKSSVTWQMLDQLIQRGDEAPGIFLIDPHLSLADAFLEAVDRLEGEARVKAIQRLRIITPDQPELVPLNLLAVPDFTWAGNAIIQIGRRIWEDYWGPRMQAALLGLFRIAHAWNQHNPQERMGLLHVVFAAYNTDWRHNALALLDPVERMGALALDALLGQNSGNWQRSWTTEVVSPILSKAMALELSDWLFAAMHQNQFVDMEQWIKDKAWIVLRLPAGAMGQESARLTAGVIYNVFDAAYRRATLYNPVPYYFVVDEAQEIGTGMRLEAMLSEGAKFGARMFVLTQSLSMMRRADGFEAVVQSLLANTSTQMFFSPDPEDADLIRATLSSSLRYGAVTLDLPSLQCWLRARIGQRWQPPTVMRVDYPPRPNQERVNKLIREVITAHPQDYAPAGDWQADAVHALETLVPHKQRGMLDELFMGATKTKGDEIKANLDDEDRQLGEL